MVSVSVSKILSVVIIMLTDFLLSRYTVSRRYNRREPIVIHVCLQSVRQDFIVPVNRERRDMVGNIILGFSTLAAAFRLKAPLPPYLPPAEESRQRLVSFMLFFQ
jgi:hypothetical protein